MSNSLSNGQLRIEFDKNNDRFAHRVFLGETPLLQSIEGDDSDPWPPSPPLQELSVEDLGGDGPVGLLVGMAGKCHWSMSVEGASGSYLFDVACRISQGEPSLLSTYRVLGDGDVTVLPDRVRLGTTGKTLELQDESGDGVSPLRFQFDESTREIALHIDNPSQSTVRWKYRLEPT